MIYTVEIQQVIPNVYAAACYLGAQGGVLMTMVEASNKSDALASIKVRFMAQKQQALKRGFKWTNHVDKFEYIFATPKGKAALVPDGAKSESPAVWELISRTEEDGSVTYSAKKHDKPLMTEEELKIALFASAVNK